LVDVERKNRFLIGRPLAALEGAEARAATKLAIPAGTRRARREGAAAEGAGAWRLVSIGGSGITPGALLTATVLAATRDRAELRRTPHAKLRSERLATFCANRMPDDGRQLARRLGAEEVGDKRMARKSGFIRHFQRCPIV
jgi:hypothetical protein